MTILDAINQGNLELAQKLIAEGSEEEKKGAVEKLDS